MKTVGAFLLLSLFACENGIPAAKTATTQGRVPQSLDEAIRAQGYAPIALQGKRLGMSHDISTEPIVEGRTIHVVETDGWRASHATFAQRRDGTIYLVIPKRIEIVDRHVAAGCLTFAGGRGWFEHVAYDIPEGAKWGGTIRAAYEDHVEVKDYKDTQDDGSPCPAPAID